MKKFIVPIILTFLGLAAAYFLFPIEQARVADHLLGYPEDNPEAHGLRPYLICLLCVIPAVAAFISASSSIMDRYLTRQFLTSFGICFLAFLSMLFLMELQNHATEMSNADLNEAVTFYLIQIPGMLMMIIPYSLMLSLLWCLGKMSKSQEIVSMVQSGRSLIRILLPFIVIGFFLTIVTGLFSYHLAPFAEGYKRSMLSELRGEPQTAAVNVGFGNPETRRFWSVGRFPRHFSRGEPLENVTISQTNEKGHLQERYIAETALWEKSTRHWILRNLTHWKFADQDGTPNFEMEPVKMELLTLDYSETPWQIIRPGLKPEQLGLPELSSWIKNHPDHPLSMKRAYQTWWHFRWAQPVICLVIVLLSAPLGISFSRRGPGGGVAVAIFLSVGMVFCNEVFPTLGESGHLSPPLAAWGTNILFLSVALVLLYRRASGQPIYQSIRKLFPSQ